VFAARSRLCGGLAFCAGAVTVTLGRVELGAVCEAAVPLRPHNNEIDRIATAEGATRLDGILMTRSPKGKTSITGSVQCISRISARVRFEIFYVGPAGRYITLQNRMSLASAVRYSGVHGKSGPHFRRRRCGSCKQTSAASPLRIHRPGWQRRSRRSLRPHTRGGHRIYGLTLSALSLRHAISLSERGRWAVLLSSRTIPG
jgi:hypothetical protein